MTSLFEGKYISEIYLLLRKYVFYIRFTFYIQNITKISKVYYAISYIYLVADIFQTYLKQKYLYLYIYITALLLHSITTFEVGLYVIPSTDLLDTFTETLCVRYNNMTLGFNFIGSELGTCGALAVSPISSLPGWLVKPFFSTLSKAHLGYLLWVSASLRWPFSLWRSSGLLHTVLALWVRVWITLV